MRGILQSNSHVLFKNVKGMKGKKKKVWKTEHMLLGGVLFLHVFYNSEIMSN